MPTPPSPSRPQNNQTPPPPPPPDSKGMSSMSWDFFFSSMENVPGSTLTEEDESRIQREELERRTMEERAKRNENDSRADETERVRKNEMPEEAEVVEMVAEPLPSQPPPPPQAATKVVKRVKNVVPGESKRKGGGQFNLLQIFSELDDCFLKASESAQEVSKMLEANRLHYHSNFADNRGDIDHSARVMRVITWNRSFRGLQNAGDGLDDFDSEEHETHATVLVC